MLILRTCLQVSSSESCHSVPGIALIHSKPYQPQGRGKIERFFRTVRSQFLSACPQDMTLQSLNDALTQWLDTHYNQNIHSSTRQTPLNRYLKHAHLVRVAPKDLDDYFRVRLQRKVDKDRTVSLNGRLYEAPVDLIGRLVTVLFHEADPARVEVFFDGISRGMLVPLDLNVNCRIRRGNCKVELLPPSGQPQDSPETVQRYEGGKLFGYREESDGI